MPINELKLAKELIRRPSVTPKDAGAINLLTKNLRFLGFKCHVINFKNITNLYAKLGKSSPNFCKLSDRILNHVSYLIWFCYKCLTRDFVLYFKFTFCFFGY